MPVVVQASLSLQLLIGFCWCKTTCLPAYNYQVARIMQVDCALQQFSALLASIAAAFEGQARKHAQALRSTVRLNS